MPYSNKWKSKTIYEGSVRATHSKDKEKRPRSPLPVKRRRRRKPKKEPPIPIPVPVKKLDTKSKKWKARQLDNEKYFRKTSSDYFLAQLLGLGAGLSNMKYLV